MSEAVSSLEPIAKEPAVEEKPSETTEGDQTVPPAEKALPSEVEKEKAALAVVIALLLGSRCWVSYLCY